jgi:hypothetical protein
MKFYPEKNAWVTAIGVTIIAFLIIASPYFLQKILEKFGIYWDWLIWVVVGLFILGFVTTVFLIVYQVKYGDIEKSALWKRIFGK